MIILGALPTPSLIKSLHKHENVKTVINLCEEFPGYNRIYEQCMIKQVRLETPDFCIPSLETMEKGIQQIHEIIRNDEQSSIYLHCKGIKSIQYIRNQQKLIQNNSWKRKKCGYCPVLFISYLSIGSI